MAIDTSIYNNIQKFEMPSMMDSQANAMKLSQLGMQNQKMQSDLVNDSQNQKLEYAKKIQAATLPTMDYLASLPEDKRAVEFPLKMKELSSQGIPMGSIPHDENGNAIYDPQHFASSYNVLKNTDLGVSHDTAKAQLFALQNSAKIDPEVRIADLRAKNSASNKNDAEAAKLRGETIKSFPNTLGQSIDNSIDPAKLVPRYVPKEHQAAALKEIDSAQNTRNMSASIMDAFDQAVKDTSGLGAITSGMGMPGVGKTPRSVEALHQAMQPTFKDLEGTVRQAAMDNTFKNISPMGLDNAKDIATRRAALEDYLQSKSASPTNSAWGIDLSKYDSTSPYKGSSKAIAKNGGMSPGLGSDANAGSFPTPPTGKILMQSPTGKMMYVNASDKGEAIASGGKVVK
jgi:hypothetical protein